jgi:hypothetical protein
MGVVGVAEHGLGGLPKIGKGACPELCSGPVANLKFMSQKFGRDTTKAARVLVIR